MTKTTYFDLNIVEGTDIVNPLVVDNPNYEKIDEVMHDNAVSGVTLATEIANATVHAITRENSECAVIRFIATSKWKAGDTATVDGVPVTVLLPNGETLPDGAYVINANVLCILTGTNLTVYLASKKVEDANEITFNNTTVGAELVRLDGEVVSLDEKIDNVSSNLNSRIDNVVVPMRGRTTLSFENGSATLTHNCGFADTNYILTFSFYNRNAIPTCCINIDGNTTTIKGMNFSGTALSTLSGSLEVNWIVMPN